VRQIVFDGGPRARIVRVLSSSALLVLAMSALGCGNKSAECNAFITVINRDGDALKRASMPRAKTAPKDMATTMRATADAADTLAADVAKVSLTAPDLVKISADYQSMAKDAAASAREIASMLDKIGMIEGAARTGAADPTEASDAIKKLTTAMQTSKTKLDAAIARESELTTRINHFCSA
jgi:hypothetical protein